MQSYYEDQGEDQIEAKTTLESDIAGLVRRVSREDVETRMHA